MSGVDTAARPPSLAAAAILDGVQALAPSIAARGGDIEAARRLPADLRAALEALGCFRMLLPGSHGGLGIELPSAMRVLDALAQADGSVSWTVGIGANGWLDVSHISRSAFDALYSDGPRTIVGAFNPSGVAVRESDGYRVNGRWAFASGCQDAHWLYGNCIEGDGSDGTDPQIRLVVFAPEQVEIEDTWTVSGLCGTGSHHFSVRDVFVPAELTGLVMVSEPCLDEPLLRIPVPALIALEIATVAVGIATAALADIVTLATRKVPLLGPATLAANSLFQYQLGEADATLRAARSLLYSDAAATWATALAGDEFTPTVRAHLRAACTWVVAESTSVVDTAYTAGGGSSLYSDHPLQRRLRDIHAITQHFLVKLDSLTMAGAVLAGQDVDLSVF
ncbi:acyl-CoA dehydrogenase family protein [Williamsia sp.]|uniref:acyl-CoA dehydrogenase family protein n=1 Tax=Williamsia sp. TaxID=1872085 RepID=UPI002F92734C